MYTCSKWLNMNLLMLDEKRAIVPKGEDTIMRALFPSPTWG